MSIFISIASYQDPLLVSTIFSAYENAQNKDGLIFSVCDQSDIGIKVEEIEFKKQIHYEHIDPIFSKGPCWARHRAQNFFNNEDYFLQIDSHTQFAQNWDQIFIDQLEKISSVESVGAYHKKPIITSYPRGFEVIDLEKGAFGLYMEDKFTQVIMYRKDSLFSSGSFSRQIGMPTKSENITHAILMAAGCIFTKGSFVREIPYDPNYYFYGEELSMALRAFTHGYSFFHIPDAPLFHLYTDVSNLPRKLHWNPEDDQNRAIKWTELDKKSLNRLGDLFDGKVEAPLNLGDVRTLEDYASISGIDLKNNTVLNLKKATESNYLESLDWKINPLKQ
ncbi:UDP-N-acetylglucosamine-transferase [Gammaproteobacteria bacterium]|nr:UDP-N-acetylglucosamine-transferase [Gammaproteobacteria bacterium]